MLQRMKKLLKDITINELTPDVLKGGSIKLKLSGNWKFTKAGNSIHSLMKMG